MRLEVNSTVLILGMGESLDSVPVGIIQSCHLVLQHATMPEGSWAEGFPTFKILKNRYGDTT